MNNKNSRNAENSFSLSSHSLVVDIEVIFINCDLFSKGTGILLNSIYVNFYQQRIPGI